MVERPRASWTDARLDDLADRVTRMDIRLTGRIEKLEASVDARFDKVDTRFDKIDGVLREVQSSMLGVQRTMILVLVAVVGAIAAGHL